MSLYATQTPGNHSLRAYYQGDGNNRSSEITVPYTVTNASPSVVLTAPATNVTFTAPADIELTATASDTDGSIAKIEFFNGATLLATVTQAPYSYTWNDVTTGSYAITAVATDNLGATATSPTTAITVIGNAAPTVSLTAPANHASFIAPADITLTAEAADSDGSVSEVAFYHDDAFIGSTTSAPYSINWPNVAAGSYQIKAVATDNQGGIATSEVVNFQVAANTPSTVSLSAEASGATAPGTINISAQASDTDGGVAKVEIFNGTSLLVTLFASPYDYQWTNVPAGSYTLTARVTDGVDGTTSSDPVPVSIAAGAGEEIYAIHADHLNTPRQITDSGNNVVWEWDNSDPFGNNVPVSNAGFEFNLRFPGQYFDKETNLHYNYYRDCYDPATGRYCQSDPIGLHGGINTYAYVGGNPISYVDPQGLQVAKAALDAAAIGGLACYFTPGCMEALEDIGRDIANACESAADAAKTWYDNIKYAKPPKDAYDPNGAKAPGKPGENDGFQDPKGGENWVRNPNGRGFGWEHKDGSVWVPTGPDSQSTGNAHGGAHWDVQRPGGGYRNVKPMR